MRIRFPCASHVPESASGQCPYLTVKAFLLPPRRTAQDLRGIFFRPFFLSTRCPQDVAGYPHSTCVFHLFSTVVCTGNPQITGRSPAKHWVAVLSVRQHFIRSLIQFPAFTKVNAGIIWRNSAYLGGSPPSSAGS